MDRKYNLKLDLQFRCNNSKMVFDEFDENTSDFFMKINRQGQEVDISNAIPTLLVLKPGGTVVSQILNIKDNFVYGNLNNSLKNEVGTYIAKLMLVEGDKKTFISNISYEVTENALLGKIDNDIVEDERYSVLLQLLERLSNIELQEQTRIDNESSRIEAENLRQEAIKKVKNDIDFLVNETNKKVNDNLNSNTSKIDNLVIDTKEELNEYKSNKDISIDEDLKEFKENTSKSIENYKTSKDIEITNSLNTYKTNTTNDINSFKNTINSEINKYKNDKDKAINEYIEAKELELNNYVEAKNKEIDNYKTSKNNELDLYVSEKNALIDSKISEVDNAKTQMQNSVNNKLIEVDNAEQIRQQEHESRQQFLNSFEGKLNTVVDDVATIKDDVVSVREANKRQDVFLQGLYNENLDGRVTIKEEGSVISLTNSDDGLVDIEGLEGNTLVNYVQDGSKELTLNGDIDVEGTNVTLTEGVDNGLVDVACEGNTLINLISLNNFRSSGVVQESIYSYKMNGVSTTPNFIAKFNKKPNNGTTLTYFAGFSIPTGATQVLLTVRDVINNYTYKLKEISITNQSSLFLKGLVDIKHNSFSDESGLQLIFNYDDKELNKNINFTVSNFILLEGDWTNKEIPTEYFEGMKSVGECEDNKIEIVSKGKNLVDKIIRGDIDNNTGEFKELSSNIECVRSEKHILVKPNTVYTISNDLSYSAYIYEYDYNKVLIKLTKNNNSTYTFTTSNSTHYITFRSISSLGQNDLNVKYQLEEGTQATEYTPYTETKKEITLSEPLRALPNGVCDKVVKIGGKHYVERNCGEVVLDGSENWVSFGYSESTVVFHSKVIDKLSKTGINIHCDKFIPRTKSWDANGAIEGIQIDADISLTIQISKSKLTTTNTSGFKQWLSENPTTVIYELQTPIYEELPIDPTLNTYNDITHISNNSTIPCNMKIQNTGYNTIIKPSTKYTVAFDTDKSGEVGINLAGSKVTTTNNVATVTTPSTLVDNSLRLTGKGIKASKVRLLEGNKTNWIPSFFKGMQSSFEDKLQDDGTYKMEILSSNKNIIDLDNLIMNNHHIHTIEKIKDGFKIKTGTTVHWAVLGEFKLKVKPNTNYTLGYTKTMIKDAYEGNKTNWDVGYTWITTENNRTIAEYKAHNNTRTTRTFNSGNNTTIRIKFNATTDIPATTGEYNFTDISLVEDTVNSTHIPHKSNKIQFSSIEPLRGVGDVKDRFVFKEDGKLMIERNCGQVVFDGSEDEGWVYDSGWRDFRWNKLSINQTSTTGDANLALCDEIVFVNYATYLNTVDGSCILFGQDRCTIKNYNINQDIETFKKWLQTNPLTVVYKLVEPTYEEISHELQKIILEGYENGTLFFDTNIPPTVEASYTANIPVVSELNKNSNEIVVTQEDLSVTQIAVDFLLMSNIGEEMLSSFNINTRGRNSMGAYFANRIMKGALKYEDVINKYPQYKEDINSILVSEGYSGLIVEL